MLHTDDRADNQPLLALRAPTKRAHARLSRWRVLERGLDPVTIRVVVQGGR